jgi:hypothetical protein
MYSPHEFLKSESGAVTVDWVVLTAAIVGLGLASMAVVSAGVEDLSDDTATHLTDIDVSESPFDSLNAFDVSGYVPLTGDANFGLITGATSGQSNDQLRNWGDLARQMAMNPANDDATRRQEADTYAARYAELQARGEDVSDMVDPRDLAAAVEADLT